MPRFFCPAPLHTGDSLALPPAAARHVQVVRLQPGDTITLFNHGPGWEGNSPGGEYEATIVRMGRTSVDVQVGQHSPAEREVGRRVHLVAGMPANDRMDWLVEKACELGVASIQPLMTERSVLRLQGERAVKKVDHWQSVATSACEQCGGNRVPLIHPVLTLAQWFAAQVSDASNMRRLLLSLHPKAQPLRTMAESGTVQFLSGPEGGLSAAEESAALDAGFLPVTLGPRTLRAETAALAALATLAIQ
jgi:16S rRNA (uracil1498-N3)-methyltransferase